MKAKLYKAIKERIEEKCPEIKHINLWNEQMLDLPNQIIFSTPAIFIEFIDIEWKQNAMGVRRADQMIRLHIIDRYIPTEGLHEALKPFAYLDTIDKVNDALWGMKGEDFNAFMHIASSMDHSHKELLDSQETWITNIKYVPSFINSI